MSCSRGNYSRKRPQKHQNKTAFRNDIHDKSKKTKSINSLEITGLCERCKEIIEWKIKYKKYKPLSAPSKCVNCNEKAVKFAYHLMCGKCASDKRACAKCMKLFEPFETHPLLDPDLLPKPQPFEDLQNILKQLPERKRRSILRYVKKNDCEDKMTPDLLACLEELMANTSLSQHDDLSDEDYASSSEEGVTKTSTDRK